MTLAEDDFLKSSTRDVWTLKRARRDELGFTIHLIASPASLKPALQRIDRLLETIASDWSAFSAQCAHWILADLRATGGDSEAAAIAASIRIRDLHIAAVPKSPLQIEASLACQALPRRFVMVAINEAGEVLGAQVGLENNDE